jgi:hypothetical protein
MRKDMARVIVERPRIFDYAPRKGRRVPFDQLPAKQGMRRPYEERRIAKSLNENLAPLRRYLERQVGRPWDKVYSEICERLRVTSTVQQHVREHLRDFVALHPRRRVYTVRLPNGRREVRTFVWHEPLYVDPRDGILKRTDRLPEEKAARRRGNR